MNPQADHNWNENQPINPSPSQEWAPETVGDEETPVQDSSKNKKRRPRGKIARLRKADRDQVNIMLRDGVPYAEIITKMGDVLKDVLPRNVGNWHNGAGYERWCKDQEWLEDMRADQESGLDLLPDFDAGKFNEAALQVAVTQLFRAMRHPDSEKLKAQLGGDPQGFARLVNALARACRETVNLQKHREAASKAAAAELKRLDPQRELTDREDEIITDRMDDFFLKPRRRRPNPEPTSTNPPPQPQNSNREVSLPPKAPDH